MTYYYAWFALFAIVAYLIATDNSIARAFYMLTQLARVQYEKVKWWALHNPANPLIKYLIWRRCMKLAKKLQKELAQNQKE
jgi:hypothetical protein